MSNEGNTLNFSTKYGNLKVTSPVSTDFPDLDIREELNSVEIDDNPYNTYGLASKIFVLSSLESHEDSKDAHKELFNEFIGKLYDMYETGGDLKVNAISDVYDNKIFANCKVVVRGDEENPRFIVTSRERETDYDSLLERVEELETIVRSLTGET